MSGTATVTLRIENHYELYSTVVTQPTTTIPLPPDPSDAQANDDWEYEHIYGETGTGRTDGDSWYFVTIVKSSVPELLGREFKFGL